MNEHKIKLITNHTLDSDKEIILNSEDYIKFIKYCLEYGYLGSFKSNSIVFSLSSDDVECLLSKFT